ncbi:Rqc2 family fibronectin-binding protein [Fervidibacillus halotolerans]|uniref:Rqc2 homolog RqcH n=1 Tax=Fervidibacillus halotolerans TaxID=2980027 RepID=A0A9E8M1H3_9BACI|nr:NFACT RNA binding domain-containing protein [Fervidibacillus halotolerans]WAA13662.1 NFACT family protein [Fervidibacillus halotolerans]
MSFDGLFTYVMTKELQVLISGRITKIHQPYPNELILVIRKDGENRKLLISAHPSFARIQLTETSLPNPKEPPMFCRLLRKHLEGFLIEQIEQMELDRIVIFRIKGRDELGDLSYKQLIVEMMGKHSNIVLMDEKKQTIIDCIKHVPHSVNRYRTLLPGQPYVWPPKQDKINPFTCSTENILAEIDFNRGRLDKQIVNRFFGISPLLAKEIVYLSGIANRLTLPEAFLNVMKEIQSGKITPSLIKTKEKDYFYLFPLKHLKGEISEFSSLSALLDRYYFEKAKRDRVKQIGGEIERFIRNEIEKNIEKMKKLKETLKEAENCSNYQLYGELLTAHLYQVKKGMTEISLTNYYDEKGGIVTIKLDPNKTPSENAQYYFNKYQKGKKTISAVKEQLKITEEELKYFESLLQQLESASPEDLDEMKEELIEQGYIRKGKTKRKKKQTELPKVEQYRSQDGTIIFVGKNNKQNDYLTMKLAKREEIWLHAKDMPGSHVVIRSTNPSEQTIQEAALLAAYFSKGRNSSNVPVDYTKVKYVRKPSGAKPGFVIYDHQQTVFVTPSEEKIYDFKNRSETN